MPSRTLLLITLLLASSIAAGCSGDTSAPNTSEPDADASPPASEPAAEEEWVLTPLPGYPEDVVPLFEVKILDTIYFSVRNDPQWVVVEGGLRNIYHSVWESNVPASEVLAYYRELCDTVDEDMTMGEQLYGTIGKYDIFLNTGRHNDTETAYLSVDLPRNELSETNPFFDSYPADIIELPSSFVIFEEMYYQTLVSSSDMSYVRHFDIADLDGDGIADLAGDARLAYFEERYGDREGFEIDREYPKVGWKDGAYSVTVSFMQDFDRGALSIGYDRVQ